MDFIAVQVLAGVACFQCILCRKVSSKFGNVVFRAYKAMLEVLVWGPNLYFFYRELDRKVTRSFSINTLVFLFIIFNKSKATFSCLQFWIHCKLPLDQAKQLQPNANKQV